MALLVAFGLCLFAMYSLTPYMLLWTGATLFNLSLLTSDAYAIIAGIFFFSYVVRTTTLPCATSFERLAHMCQPY